MIQNSKRILRIPVDTRGKITSGMKSEKGYPKSLDYFDVSKFSEIEFEYGDKPKKLVIAVPTNNIADYFDDSFNLYGKDTKIRSCDGETCVNRITGEIKPCFCRELPEKEQCKYSMYLKASILKKDGSFISNKFYMFHTGSQNSGNNILFALNNAIVNGNDLKETPFGLEVKMVSGKESVKTLFPIWSLTPLVDHNSDRRLEIFKQLN